MLNPLVLGLIFGGLLVGLFLAIHHTTKPENLSSDEDEVNGVKKIPSSPINVWLDPDLDED